MRNSPLYDVSRGIVTLVILCAVQMTVAGAESSAAPGVKLTGNSIVDPAALHLPAASWNTTVNGMSFQQAALATHKSWQYTTWWDGERRLCLARRKLPDGPWQAIRFTDYHIKSNDTHNVTVLGICAKDGTIHMAFDHHGHPLHYRVSRPGAATHPEEVSWTADLFGPVMQELQAGKPIKGVTYPRFIPAPDGNLQLLYRTGGSGNGDWVLADYDPRTGWTQPEPVLSRSGTYGQSTSRCAYLHGIGYDHRARLHLSWVWRETGDPMTNHDLNYAYSDDRGRTWMDSEGNRAGVRGEQAMGLTTPGIQFRRIDMNRGLSNSTTQTVDSQGRAHIVNFHLPDDVNVPSTTPWAQMRRLTRYMHYWRDDRGVWRRNETPFKGARPQVFADSADNLYLVYTGDRYLPEDRDLVIVAAGPADQWRTWSEVGRVRGPFTGQPQVDRSRGDDILAVYVQEYPSDPQAAASPLRVIEFRTNVAR
jgi:hypothetical protein